MKSEFENGKKELIDRFNKKELRAFPLVVRRLLIKIMIECLDAGYKYGKGEKDD